jgi:hypothetical protein
MQPDPSSDAVITAIRSVAATTYGENLSSAGRLLNWHITAMRCAANIYAVFPNNYIDFI